MIKLFLWLTGILAMLATAGCATNQTTGPTSDTNATTIHGYVESSYSKHY